MDFKALINKTQSGFKNILERIKAFLTNTFSKRSNTFFFLLYTLLFAIAIPITITLIKGGFYSYNTDDKLQYFPFVRNFVNDVKSGNVSIFDTTVFAGTSIFATLYYVPIDIFMILTILLSYMMNVETAYAITNFLRVVAGSLLIFILLTRQGRKNKTAFLVSLIFFSTGLVQSLFVFPVYVGIMFYVPLAMLLIDLFIDNKKFFYLLPAFVVTLVLYDFYITYMILAFMMIYVIVRCHILDKFSFIGKNTFIKNKNFYTYVLGTLALILIGVGMSSFILIPSFYYMTFETNRTTPINILAAWKSDKWQFLTYDIGHYFTMWANFFIPNDPWSLMLIPTGGYVREHASLSMTITGFAFLLSFFTLKGKENNRLKFWVILLNIMLLIPGISMIFTASTIPYIRWFFIIYIFNMLAMAKGMDECNFEFKTLKSKIVVGVGLTLGLITIVYVLLGNVAYTITKSITILGKTYNTSISLFLHYAVDSEFFYPILLISVITFALFFTIFILGIVLKKRKELTKVLLPVLICLECVAALAVNWANSDSASSYYYDNANAIVEVKENFETRAGYKDSSGYRICFDNGATKDITNSQSISDNVNMASYFHSFYNDSLNDLFQHVLFESNNSWSKKYNLGYNIIASPIFNTKYVAIRKAEIVDMNSLYALCYSDSITLKANTEYIIACAYLDKDSSKLISDATIDYSNVKLVNKTSEQYDVATYTNNINFSETHNSKTSYSVPSSSDALMASDVYDTETGFKVDIILKIGASDLEVSAFDFDFTYDRDSFNDNNHNVGFYDNPTFDGSFCLIDSGLNYSYTTNDSNSEYNYYELKDLPPFTVYSKASTYLGNNLLERMNGLMHYAYYDNSNDEIKQMFEDSEIPLVDTTEVTKLNTTANILYRQTDSSMVDTENNYFVYNLSSINMTGKDTLTVFANDSDIRSLGYEDMYVVDTLGNIHGMTYSTCYINDYTPAKLYVKWANSNDDKTMGLYFYNSTSIYNSYLNEQNQYTDKYFKINGSELQIKFNMTSSDTVKIVKTSYTYSDNFKVNDNNYRIINVDGGFLGIVVPKNTEKVDIVVTYYPETLTIGYAVTAGSFLVYGGITFGIIFISRRKKKHEKDICNSTLL